MFAKIYFVRLVLTSCSVGWEHDLVALAIVEEYVIAVGSLVDEVRLIATNNKLQ